MLLWVVVKLLFLPQETRKSGKNDVFWVAADNNVPESTRIPVYMGVQPIKLKNMFPLIVYRATGWIHTLSYEQGGGDVERVKY